MSRGAKTMYDRIREFIRFYNHSKGINTGIKYSYDKNTKVYTTKDTRYYKDICVKDNNDKQ